MVACPFIILQKGCLGNEAVWAREETGGRGGTDVGLRIIRREPEVNDCVEKEISGVVDRDKDDSSLRMSVLSKDKYKINEGLPRTRERFETIIFIF